MVLGHEPLLLWPKTVPIAKCCFLDKIISEIYIVIADLVFFVAESSGDIDIDIDLPLFLNQRFS